MSFKPKTIQHGATKGREKEVDRRTMGRRYEKVNTDGLC